MKYKHISEKQSASRKTVRKMLALIPVLVLAVAAYSVSVFAWFQASLTNEGNFIQAGEFSARVELVGENNAVLWDGDHLCEYDGAVAIFPQDTATVTLRIIHQGSLPYQYQIALSSGGDRFTLTADADTPAYTPDKKQILDVGETHTYTIALPASSADLRLQFRAVFQNNPVPTLSNGTGGQQNILSPQVPSRESTGGPASVSTETTTALTTASTQPESPAVVTDTTEESVGTTQATTAPSQAAPEDNTATTSDVSAPTGTDRLTAAPPSETDSQAETSTSVQPKVTETTEAPGTMDEP